MIKNVFVVRKYVINLHNKARKKVFICFVNMLEMAEYFRTVTYILHFFYFAFNKPYIGGFADCR